MSARPAYILPALVASQFAGTSLWFASNAILGDLIVAWNLAPNMLAWTTSMVQLGFILGTLCATKLALADRYPAHLLFAGAALLGGGCNLMPLLIPGGEFLLVSRFLVGVCLAGIYPVGMKLAASWYDKGLGEALGFLVGALVLGTALPHGLQGAGVSLPWEGVLGVVSGLAILGGLVVWGLVPVGPYLKAATSQEVGEQPLREVLKHRGFMAAAAGYFGHMWELYAFWAFVPLMVDAYTTMRGVSVDVSLVSFVVIASGAVGCVGAGYASRRWGSAWAAQVAMGCSGACCLAAPAAYFWLPWPGFMAFLVVWGVTVVADSGQLSTLSAKMAPERLVGTALTLLTCVGFGITVVSIHLMGGLVDVLGVAWIFVVLGVGPILGIGAVSRLRGQVDKLG